MKKTAIVRFLGTNCDRDVWQAVEAAGLSPEWWWYQDRYQADEVGSIIVPGGFSHGDYLRAGALAARAPVMDSVREAAKKGIPILGICNGFQVLCDSGLLPGALVRNESLRFVDEWVDLQLAHPSRAFAGQRKSCRLPVAHGEGRYYIDDDELKRIEDQGQVWWTYQNNPNGSINDIAGVLNEDRSVAGLMPHPERAIFDWMGGDNGKWFFESLAEQGGESWI